MKNHWAMLAALILFSAGCERTEEISKASDQQTIPNQTEAVVPSENEADKTFAGDVEKTETDSSAKLDAREVLQAAIDDAKAKDKRLFVHFSADW